MSGAGPMVDGADRPAPAVPSTPWAMFFVASIAVFLPVAIGDVVIHPGDIVVADRDGIAIVPAGRIETVLAAALDREQKESPACVMPSLEARRRPTC